MIIPEGYDRYFFILCKSLKEDIGRMMKSQKLKVDELYGHDVFLDVMKEYVRLVNVTDRKSMTVLLSMSYPTKEFDHVTTPYFSVKGYAI